MYIPVRFTHLQIATVCIEIVNHLLQVCSFLHCLIVFLNEIVRCFFQLVQNHHLSFLCISDGFPVWCRKYTIGQTKSKSHWKTKRIDAQFIKVNRIIDIIQTQMHITITSKFRKLEEFMSCNYKVITNTIYIKVDTFKISQLLSNLILKAVPIIIFDRYNHLDTIRLICGCFI